MQGEEKQKPRRRSLAGRIVNAVLAVLTFSLLVAAVALMLGVNAPDWMRQRLESRLNLTLNSGRIVLGNIRVTAFSTGINPEITLRNVRILNSDGRVRAALPEVVGDFALIDLLKGRLRPVRVVLNGAHLVLNRDENARFDISVGDDAAGLRPATGRGGREPIRGADAPRDPRLAGGHAARPGRCGRRHQGRR